MLCQTESGMVIDEAGNKLLVKSVMFCRMMPFVITEEGDIDDFAGGKMEAVYQADDQFFEGQVKELHVEWSQRIIMSVFRALTGSRHKTRRRQMTGIPPMPVMAGSTTPTTKANAQVSAAQVETAQESLM